MRVNAFCRLTEAEFTRFTLGDPMSETDPYEYEVMRAMQDELEWVNNVVTTETMRGMFQAMVTEQDNRIQQNEAQAAWSMQLDTGEEAESSICALRFGETQDHAGDAPDMTMRIAVGALQEATSQTEKPGALRVDEIAAHAMTSAMWRSRRAAQTDYTRSPEYIQCFTSQK